MKKKILIFPSILFFLVLSIFFYLLAIERNPYEIPSNLLNKKVPIFEARSLLKNEKFISSNEFKNGITLVNFFATWCKPCRDEHVYMKSFSSEKNVNVIGINYKDDPEKTVKWLKDLGNPYKDVLIDKNGKIAIDWGVYGIPETFIINSNGIVKYRHVGPVTNVIYKKINLIITTIFLTDLITNSSYAVEPDEILKNQKYELRARNISKNIRCMVCQNQSIDESSAPLAKDLRILIRDKIKEGNKDEEIYKFLTDRYGDFILLKPPLNSKNLILWFFPFIFLILGIYVVFYHNKKSG